MKFSTKDRYALRLMLELAGHKPDEFVPLKTVSERQGISLKYLEQIITPLARAGLAHGFEALGLETVERFTHRSPGGSDLPGQDGLVEEFALGERPGEDGGPDRLVCALPCGLSRSVAPGCGAVLM